VVSTPDPAAHGHRQKRTSQHTLLPAASHDLPIHTDTWQHVVPWQVCCNFVIHMDDASLPSSLSSHRRSTGIQLSALDTGGHTCLLLVMPNHERVVSCTLLIAPAPVILLCTHSVQSTCALRSLEQACLHALSNSQQKSTLSCSGTLHKTCRTIAFWCSQDHKST
jgi:hypothetical protein